jgi:hypothetical protein
MIFKIPAIKTEDLKDNLRVVLVAYDDDLDITYLMKEDVLGEYKKKEADAELGRAVRYLASNHISVPMQYMPDYITDETIEYIVKTAKKVVEQC